MNERLSALVDGELGQADTGDLLKQLKGGRDLRQSWDTYHLIGDALRGHLDVGVAGRVSARLADEPTVLAPRPRAMSTKIAQFSLSLAASVAAVGLVVWMALPAVVPEVPQVASVSGVNHSQAVNAAAPAASLSTPATPVAVGVDGYLLAHQGYSPAGTMQGVAPYVRTVSETERDRRK